MSSLRKDNRERLRGSASLLGWAGILAVCMGLAAVEIVPACQVLPWVQIGPQGEGASAISRNYQLHLVNALQLLSPRALGGPADYFGHDNYWESVLSFGLVTLVLIGAGTVLSRGRSKVRGWLVMVLLATWFAAGRQLGLLTVLSWLVPGNELVPGPRAIPVPGLGGHRDAGRLRGRGLAGETGASRTSGDGSRSGSAGSASW